jgi:hypothetical protein
MRITFVTIVLVAGMTIVSYAQNQCTLKIDHSVIDNGPKGYSIALESKVPLANVHVQLVDLYTGKVTEEKDVVGGISNKQVIFNQVKTSLYVVYVKYDGCEKARSVGEIQGIKVGKL